MEREFNIKPLLINHQPLPGKNSWVKILIYEPADVSVLKTRGTMYAVLSLSAKSNVDFTAIMQLILEELHTQYFQQTSGGILQALEVALDSIHKKLILMGQQDKRLGESFKFNLLTAVSWGTVLYFGQLGNSRAALYRNGKLFDIDEGEQKTTNLYLSSGVLQSKDRVILGTDQLFKRFNRTTLKQILSKPQEKIVKALEDELDPGPARVGQSGIVLTVDIKQVPSIKEEAFRIKDPGNDETEYAGRSFGLAPFTNIFKAVTSGAKSLVGWKLFGKVPFAPIAVVLIAIAALGYSLSGGQVWQPEFGPSQELVANATKKISQAEEVAAINPDRAQDLLNQAVYYIDQGLTDYPANEQLLNLKDQYDQILQQILIINTLDPIIVSSLNIEPTQPKLVIHDSTVYVVDALKDELLSISQFGKSQVISRDHHFSRGSLIASTDNGILLSSKGKVMPVSSGGQLGQPETLADVLQPISLAGFMENGYMLEAAGQIYRMPNQIDAIGQTSRYFINSINAEGLVDIAVDGHVYILRENGEVEVFLNGEEQQLTLERSSLIHEAKSIFTSEDSSNLYVLQTDAILAWTKKGKYLGQYQLPDKKKLDMAGIDYSNGYIYILSGGNLLQSPLP